jgi:hypothetical protein
MNSPYSPEQAAESSALTCSDGRLSDTSNGTPTVSVCSPQESLTDSSHAPQSLATCVSSYSPVPLSNTEDLRTWLQQVSPANHSAWQESNSEQTTGEICGPPRGTLFAWFDRTTSSWRMSQGCLLAGTQESLSQTWPTWGMWANGECYELPSSALPTVVPDGGLLPTPTATDWKRTPMKASYANRPSLLGVVDDLAKWAVRNSGLAHARLVPDLWEWAMGWPLMWTELKPLETDKFQEWLQQHGNY